MNKIKAYKFLWWTIPVVFLPIALGTDGAFDLQMHDTYFIIASIHIAIFFALLLGFLGGIYWMSRANSLNPKLSMFHSFGTSFTLIGIAFVAILQSINRMNNFEYFRQLNSIGTIFILLFLTFQLLFIANLSISLIKRIMRNVK